ncbi:MAG TPA: ABC transporter ATP-binding protein [Spirochaetes bacterium]|nr:ABC transporter ATP-binding protein [Spirochaetota bacterium]
MNYYDEESIGSERVYSGEVLKLIFSYVFVYKKYLFLSLFFVLFITGANLSVPYLFKIIIDRYIFKQGQIIHLDAYSSRTGNNLYDKQFRRGKYLSGTDRFLFQSRLKYFSKNEKEDLVNSGALSSKKYVFIESPRFEGELGKKIDSYILKGEILVFGESIYLFETGVLSRFKVEELARLRSQDFVHIVRYIMFIIGILLVQFVSSYIQIMFLMKLSQMAMKDLRKDLFSHILTLEVSFFDKNPIGRLVNKVTNDIETLNEFFSSVLITLFQDILLMLGIAFVMFFTDVYLALIVAATYPFIIIITILFRIQVRNAYRKIRTRITDINGFLNETITGIRIIQIFVMELNNFKKFLLKNNAVYKAQLKQLYVFGVFRPLIGFLRWVSIAAVIYFGARGIVGDRISFGLLVMFIAYIERFFAPVRDLSEKFDIMQSATAAGEKLISILKADAVKETDDDFKVLPEKGTQFTSYSDPEKVRRPETVRFKGKIVFDDVWFSYKPDEWVLRGVSFSMNPGETLAIVGETGAGKTTIISILSKFYRIQKGKIFIDGADLNEIPYGAIRRNIVSVMQDVFLFSRNVRENITLGLPYDEAYFKTVSKATHIEKFIKKLPAGELEPVMERGATFSAGERQLLSFARALYFDPSILVLDEATSSIDTETERFIQDAIAHLTRGRTSIIIAHRLSTIKNADRIIVLDRGKIVEEGRHRELIQKKGIYHKLYSLQFSDRPDFSG